MLTPGRRPDRCPACKGAKVVNDDHGKPVLCKTCGGHGAITGSHPGLRPGRYLTKGR